jgi:hypothetical protein
MKDLPHHMKKLNRRVIRSMHREEMEELPEIPAWTDSPREAKKKAKIKMKKDTLARPSSDLTPDQRNKIMKKGRVPVFDRTNNMTPKHARPSKKKTPRI